MVIKAISQGQKKGTGPWEENGERRSAKSRESYLSKKVREKKGLESKRSEELRKKKGTRINETIT